MSQHISKDDKKNGRTVDTHKNQPKQTENQEVLEKRDRRSVGVFEIMDSSGRHTGCGSGQAGLQWDSVTYWSHDLDQVT